MQQQPHYPTLTVTPHGIMIDGMPLTKSVRQNLPPYTLRSIASVEESLKQVKPEDWGKPYDGDLRNIPPLMMAKTKAALASPQPFPPPLHKQSEQPLYNPDWHYTL